MIYGIYGEGGTGKSALAVSFALDNLEKYDYIFTNIYDFGKNDSVNDIAKQKNTDINIVSFENDKNAFVMALHKIQDLFKENNNLNFLVLYDECHKSLRSFTKTNQDDIFVSDFLSEHRHKHCDFYMMTQGYKKIDYKYKEDSIDLQLKNNIDNLEFKLMDKENKIKVKDFTFKKSTMWLGYTGKEFIVFDCYTSGDNGEKRVNTGMTLLSKKKLMFKILLVFAVISLIYAFFSISSMLSSKKKDNHTVISSVSSPGRPVSNISTSDISNNFQKLSDNLQNTQIVSKYKILNCLFDNQLNIYYFNNFTLNQKNFTSLSSYYLFTVLSVHTISNRFVKIQFLVDKSVVNEFSTFLGNSNNGKSGKLL